MSTIFNFHGGNNVGFSSDKEREYFIVSCRRLISNPKIKFKKTEMRKLFEGSSIEYYVWLDEENLLEEDRQIFEAFCYFFRWGAWFGSSKYNQDAVKENSSKENSV